MPAQDRAVQAISLAPKLTVTETRTTVEIAE